MLRPELAIQIFHWTHGFKDSHDRMVKLSGLAWRNKNWKGESWGHTTQFFWRTPGIFRFVTLSLEIPDKKSFILLEILQNSNSKNQDPWKFHMIFSWLCLEIPHCAWKFPGVSTCYFFNTPQNSMSTTLLFGFFWVGNPISLSNIFW